MNYWAVYINATCTRCIAWHTNLYIFCGTFVGFTFTLEICSVLLNVRFTLGVFLSDKAAHEFVVFCRCYSTLSCSSSAWRLHDLVSENVTLYETPTCVEFEASASGYWRRKNELEIQRFSIS